MGFYKSAKCEEAVNLLYKEYTKETFKKAAKLLEEACEENDPDAFYFLHRCFMGNQFIWKFGGFEEDEQKSDDFLRLSVKKGSCLGVLGAYRMNMLTDVMKAEMPFENVKEAKDEVLKRAEAGDGFAQYMIGNTYFWDDIYEIDNLAHPLINNDLFIKLGKNDKERNNEMEKIEKDVADKAIYWFEKSLAQGYIWCAINLLNIYRKGMHPYPPNPTEHERVLKTCAKTGNPYSEYLLADKYDDEKKYDEAFKLYLSSAQKGHLDSWFSVGYMYLEGTGVTQNTALAIENFEKAIPANNQYAFSNLGFIYFTGKDTDVDYGKAFHYFKKAAEFDNKYSYAFLGDCYLKGLGTEKNYKIAKEYFEKANKTTRTLNGLGQIYAYGLGVPEDIKKGMDYFTSANNSEAKDHMSNFKKKLFGGWVRKK